MNTGTYIVNASKLNVRSGPGSNYPVVKTLSNGNSVTVIKISGDWAQIANDRWCSISYLTPVNSGKVTPSVSVSESGRPTYFLQGDSRWGSIRYSIMNDATQTIKSSGCGPTCAAMLINYYIDNKYSPVDCCAWCLEKGYRTENNGTAWGMFKALAVKYGFNFLQTGSIDEAKKFMKNNKNAHCVCIMSKGNWTSGGHYILCWKMDDTNVYVNDPASTAANRVKNTQKLLASQCRQYFCFSYGENKTTWEPTTTVTNIDSIKFAVSASKLTVRSSYSTDSSIVGYLTQGSLVTATKKCGDWYYVQTDKIKGWASATYLQKATLDNVNSDLAYNTKDAINYLVKIGFMDSPDWWRTNCFEYNNVTYLLIKIADRIKVEEDQVNNNTFKFTIADLNKAIDHLVELGVINTPDLWKKQCINTNKLNNIGYLMIKAANYID